MRKNFVVLLVVLLSVFCANVVFAQSNATVTGVNADADVKNDLNNYQDQDQYQWMYMGGATSTGTGGTVSYKAGRGFPNGQELPSFVGSGNGSMDDLKPMTCVPLLRVFKFEQLEAAQGSKFWGGVNVSLRQEEVSEFNKEPVTRLELIPIGPSDELVAEIMVEGKEGQGLLPPLSKAILIAKKKTNTNRVCVWYGIKRGGRTSGISIGSGVAGSQLFGSSEMTGGTVGLGGLIGTTWSHPTVAVVVKVWAFNPGSTTPPPGMDPCEQQVVKNPPPTPTPTPVVPAPAPAPKPEVKAPPCKDGCCTILRRIVELDRDIANCYPWCFNNMKLRVEAGDAAIAAWKCTGEGQYLDSAIYHFSRAEMNYRRGGDDIRKNQTEADRLLHEAHYSWSGVIYQLYGEGAAKAFAVKKGLERIPGGYARK